MERSDNSTDRREGLARPTPGKRPKDQPNREVASVDGTSLSARDPEPVSAPLSGVGSAPVSAPGDADEWGLKHSTGQEFRSTRRSLASGFKFALLRGLSPEALVPVLIVAAGAALAALITRDGLISAFITAVTAALCGLAIHITHAIRKSRAANNSNLRARFEKLEDRAWELQESEERYRAIAGVFGDAMVMRDSENRVTYCNRAFADLAKTDVETLVQTEQLPESLQSQFSGSNNEGPIREIRIQTEKGERWFEWHDLPVRDEKSGGVATLSIARDITAFRHSARLDAAARKKAEEASRAKSRFLAMVSHEMRTPLNGVIGMSKLLASTSLTPEQRNYCSALMTSGENLLGLIDGMLDLTIIETGHFEIKNQEFNIHELLNNAVELLSPRAYAKDIDCGLFIDPLVPVTITGDPGRIRQIIFNLAGNAIKFTRTGGVMIRCLLDRNSPGAGARLRLEILDTGPGLSERDRERVFEEFERVDDEITRHTDGAGLGLAISRALARELGGSLVLEKTAKDGSLFVCVVPVSLSGERQDTVAKAELPVKKLDGKKCLVVSVSTMEPASLCQTLAAEGAIVDRVTNLEEARARLKAGLSSYFAVFFDPHQWPDPHFLMAGMASGRNPEARLVVVTLPQNKREIDAYLKSGADAWLVRPVRKSSLMAVMEGERTGGTLNERTLHSGADLNPEAFKPESKSPPTEPSRHVLLAEDNDINALLVTAALQKRNIRVTRALNGDEAVALFKSALNDGKSQPFKMILMDMHMPVCDGYSATSRIRQMERKLQNHTAKPVVIYALTADEQNESRKRSLEAGVDGFLLKPVDPAELCDLAEHYLDSTLKPGKSSASAGG